MKKNALLFTVLFVSLFASNLFSQTFKKGDMIGQVGIGFGSSFYQGDATIPPIAAGLQFGVTDKISVGGIIGYTASTYKYAFWNSSYEWKYSYVLVGGRGEYHFLESKEWDLYGGLTLGYNVVSVSEPSNSAGVGYTAAASALLLGGHVGARYYFSPKFGLYGELGYGMGYLMVGAAFKL